MGLDLGKIARSITLVKPREVDEYDVAAVGLANKVFTDYNIKAYFREIEFEQVIKAKRTFLENQDYKLSAYPLYTEPWRRGLRLDLAASKLLFRYILIKKKRSIPFLEKFNPSFFQHQRLKL